MIFVRVELWPGGDHTRRQVLGEAAIANDGETTGYTDGKLGHYHVKLSKRGGFKLTADQNTWKTGHVGPFRRRSGGAWDLVRLALDQVLGDRDFTPQKLHARKVRRLFTGKPIQGYRCKVCHEPVTHSPGGPVCTNGHGGCEEPVP